MFLFPLFPLSLDCLSFACLSLFVRSFICFFLCFFVPLLVSLFVRSFVPFLVCSFVSTYRISTLCTYTYINIQMFIVLIYTYAFLSACFIDSPKQGSATLLEKSPRQTKRGCPTLNVQVVTLDATLRGHGRSCSSHWSRHLQPWICCTSRYLKSKWIPQALNHWITVKQTITNSKLKPWFRGPHNFVFLGELWSHKPCAQLILPINFRELFKSSLTACL